MFFFYQPACGAAEATHTRLIVFAVSSRSSFNCIGSESCVDGVDYTDGAREATLVATKRYSRDYNEATGRNYHLVMTIITTN